MSEVERSGWTVDTLHAHMQAVIEANDQRYSQRFEAQSVAMSAALAAAKEAVIKAENASEKRFESVNEFRALVDGMIRTLMPRAEAEKSFESVTEKIESLNRNTNDKVEALNKATGEKIDALTKLSDVKRGESAGLRGGWAVALAAAGLISLVVSIWLAVTRR